MKGARQRPARRRLPFEILYEDGDIVAIDKPAGLLSTHTRLRGRAAREGQATAENMLNVHLRKGQAKSRRRVWLVHRLDRDTSGVMMFAKSEAVAESFRSAWGELTEKTYLALVAGEMEGESGVFEGWLREDADGYRVRVAAPGEPGARPARTEWRRISSRGGATLVEVNLCSGRKNQIRVHFAAAGHPVVGDAKYGGPKAPRMRLHSLRLRVRRPSDGEWIEIVSPSDVFGPRNAGGKR